MLKLVQFTRSSDVLRARLLARFVLSLLAGYCSMMAFEPPEPDNHVNQRGKYSDSFPGISTDYEGEFSCGGGPFSYFMASLVSVPCDRHQIHLCCADHDHCYDSPTLNQTYCDQMFCACLDRIPSSLYCEKLAQPGLCAATHVFGHLFHPQALSAFEEQLEKETQLKKSPERI